MPYKKLMPLYVGNLSTKEIFSLNKTTIDYADSVSSDLDPIATNSLKQLREYNNALGASLNKNQKSALTEEMQTYDQARDTDIREIFRVTKTYLRSRDEERKTAASILQLFLAPYKGIERMPLDVESGIVSEMLNRYKSSAELKTAATTIGVNAIFATLETNNAAFDRLYNERTTEKSERASPASSLKWKAIGAYTQFCTSIEQALAFTPSDTLLALFNQLDELRKQYRPLESKTKTKK